MARRENKVNTVFGGAAILAGGAAVVKVIGAIFKIPLSNILGDLGFGHFNNAYVIFGVLLTVSTAGLPVALSKSVSEAHTLGRHNQVRKIFSVSLITFLILGIISFLFMFLGAEELAIWMGNSGAVSAIRVLAPCAFFVCVMSAFRGFAQGHMNMVPTSVSQVIEAAFKLVIGLALAWYVMTMTFSPSMLPAAEIVGKTAGEIADLVHELQSEYGAAASIFGVTAGSVFGLIYLVLNYLRSRRPSERDLSAADGAGAILSRLAKIAVPITLGSSVVSVVTFLDTNLVQHRLQDALGYAEAEAVALYGAYQRAMAIYNLPPYFAVPLAASIVPAVAACLARRDGKRAEHISESFLRMTALMACPVGVGMSVLATPIISLLYSGTNVAVAGAALTVLGTASICVSIMLICNAILQAHGFVNLPILTAVLGGVVKLAVNYVLVGNPAFGIFGAPIGTLACFGLVAVLDMVIIARVIPNPPSFLRAFAKPLLASVLMGGAAWAAHGLVSLLLPGRLATVVGIGVGGLVYLVLVISLRIISPEDVALMPKGEKIAKFLRLS